MTALPDAQIAALAGQAGWTGQDKTIAVAVCLAESSGNPDAMNSIPCVGLWQVNLPAHRQEVKEAAANLNPRGGNLLPDSALISYLKVPANNAKLAHSIWKQQGWARGWTTYSGGAYRKYMDRAAAATKDDTTVADPGLSSPVVPAAPQSSDSLGGQIQQAINGFGESLRDTGLLGLVLLVALVLIVLGVVLLSRNGVANTVGKVAKATPIGAVL